MRDGDDGNIIKMRIQAEPEVNALFLHLIWQIKLRDDRDTNRSVEKCYVFNYPHQRKAEEDKAVK